MHYFDCTKFFMISNKKRKKIFLDVARKGPLCEISQKKMYTPLAK